MVRTHFKQCSNMVRTRFEHSSDIVRTKFEHGSNTVRTYIEHGSNIVRTRFEHSSDIVATQFEHGSNNVATLAFGIRSSAGMLCTTTPLTNAYATVCFEDIRWLVLAGSDATQPCWRLGLGKVIGRPRDCLNLRFVSYHLDVDGYV